MKHTPVVLSVALVSVAVALPLVGANVTLLGTLDDTACGPNSPVDLQPTLETNCEAFVSHIAGPLSLIFPDSFVAASPDGEHVFVATSLLRHEGFDGADFATASFDAATGQEEWRSFFHSFLGGTDAAADIAVSPDGSIVYVTGFSRDPDFDVFAFSTVAYDATTGAELWVSLVPGPMRLASGEAIAASPDGSRVFVTGYATRAGTDIDYQTVALGAATGTLLWSSFFATPGANWDFAGDIAVSPDGSRVAVTGYTCCGLVPDDASTVVYDAATGAEFWSDTFQGPAGGEDHLHSVAFSPDGSLVFAAGHADVVNGATLSSDALTLAYDAETGTPAWTSFFDGAGSAEDAATALAVSPDGSRVYATGWSERVHIDVHDQSILDHLLVPRDVEDFDFATIAYDVVDGQTVWTTIQEGPSLYDVARDIEVDPSGDSVYVTGYSADAVVYTDGEFHCCGFGPVNVQADFVTAKYDAATGESLWNARFDGPTSDGDVPFDLAVDPDGDRVYVVGFTYDANADEDGVALVAYDADPTF